jgi:hypothetical protein
MWPRPLRHGPRSRPVEFDVLSTRIIWLLTPRLDYGLPGNVSDLFGFPVVKLGTRDCFSFFSGETEDIIYSVYILETRRLPKHLADLAVPSISEECIFLE